MDFKKGKNSFLSLDNIGSSFPIFNKENLAAKGEVNC